MRIFCLLSLVAFASAAVVPVDGLAVRKLDLHLETNVNGFTQRRDVSEISSEYLPPNQEISNEPIQEEDPQKSAILGDQGYEYKTVRRLKLRQRRDVSEIANEYLPPTEESSNESLSELKSVDEKPQDSAVLGDQGYEYKTVRRLKLRQRRDVSEIASKYLPPTEESSNEPITELKSEDEESQGEESQDSAVLGEQGYEYKTVRRLKFRQRRDVSEIANEYLPPNEESSMHTLGELKADDEKEPQEPESQGEESQDSAVLGDQGYEYKTVRRLKLRQRRDVSEISSEYLPPTEETSKEPIAELISDDEESQDSAVLGDEGYEYKTVRRLKLRQRRDVSEIASEYLPPAEETSNESLSELKADDEESQDSAVLGDQGYEYKSVRRLKLRQRRDVSEIASEYLPPTGETSNEPITELKSDDEESQGEESQDSAVLGDQGYEYKTVRRLKLRQRRDVSEIASEYLPPNEETSEEPIAELNSDDEESQGEESQDSAVLGDQGYEYKTVRRLKLRQRRDVSEIANEYLPPNEEASVEPLSDLKSDDEKPQGEESQDSAVLGDQGYEYKTVRRLKLRQRRNVPEISKEYLAPNDDVGNESQDSSALGDEGYEYKTVRRLKYRQRRATTFE